MWLKRKRIKMLNKTLIKIEPNAKLERGVWVGWWYWSLCRRYSVAQIEALRLEAFMAGGNKQCPGEVQQHLR